MKKFEGILIVTTNLVANLSVAYDFSGVEIGSIVRKSTMKEIISSKKVSLVEIEAMCRMEKLNTGNAKRIGFMQSPF